MERRLQQTTLVTSVGAPVIVVVGAGIAGGIVINEVIDYVKTEFLVENKK